MQLEDAEVDQLSLSDWSFTQLCKLCGVQKDTVNKLTSETASRVFRDTLPVSRKPLQVYAAADTALAVHSSTYSRLFDAEVLQAVREAAPDFTPPPPGIDGATGLYAGEQDMFAFGIDPGRLGGDWWGELRSRLLCVELAKSAAAASAYRRFGIRQSARTTSSGTQSRWWS